MSLSKQEFINLQHEWRLKLKESGFNDIELWDNTVNKKKVRFIKGHVRWSSYKNKENYFKKEVESATYYRVIGLYIHHAPNVPEKYKMILQHYVEIGLMPPAIKKSGLNIPPASVWSYLCRNFPKMMIFVKKLDEEAYNE